MKKNILKIANLIGSKFGYKFVKENEVSDFYLYEYNSYEEYKDTQIFHNNRKINSVFADETTLKNISEIIHKRFNKDKILGLCHGSRNGFEQNYLNTISDKVNSIGTDISDTANKFDNSIHWDFHDEKEDWINNFDFIYTNSLDQSWNPKLALTTWLNQINDDGILIIEHTVYHGPEYASEMDPFGVKPTVMPYVLTEWFGDQINISHTKNKKDNMNVDAFLFVISKNNRIIS